MEIERNERCCETNCLSRSLPTQWGPDSEPVPRRELKRPIQRLQIPEYKLPDRRVDEQVRKVVKGTRW